MVGASELTRPNNSQQGVSPSQPPSILTKNEAGINPSLQNPRLEDKGAGEQDGIIIAAIGMVGCGKSTFLSKFPGSYSPEVELEPECEGRPIQVIKCVIGKRDFLLIDTQELNTNRGGVAALSHIAKWLREEYGNRKLSGLIYMHDIGAASMEGWSVKFLKLLREVTGEENMTKVVLLTTKWDQFRGNKHEGDAQEVRLHEEWSFWKGMVADGAKEIRDGGTEQSAKDVISTFLEKTSRKANLQADSGSVRPRDANPKTAIEKDVDKISQQLGGLGTLIQDLQIKYDEETSPLTLIKITLKIMIILARKTVAIAILAIKAFIRHRSLRRPSV